VAKKPLPGAAPSAPRVLVARATAPPGSPQPAVSAPAAAPAAVAPIPRLDMASKSRTPTPATEVQSAATGSPDTDIPAFHLAAVVAGGCLWLEPLAGSELAPEPLQLIRAMAFALQRKQESPQVTRFAWPLHSNRQLDLSAGAAAAALTGFVLRQVQDRHCGALVLLGPSAGEHLLQPQLDGVPIVLLPATGDMLARPQSKREAWQALAALGSQ